jgi:hypothetical protein
MRNEGDNLHTVPTIGEHTTVGLDCWCSPTYLLPCDECESGCWKCVGGSIALTRAEAGASESPLVVVHNR